MILAGKFSRENLFNLILRFKVLCDLEIFPGKLN
jgi:hypothetical protein